jgi:hypothetical protein
MSRVACSVRYSHFNDIKGVFGRFFGFWRAVKLKQFSLESVAARFVLEWPSTPGGDVSISNGPRCIACNAQ